MHKLVLHGLTQKVADAAAGALKVAMGDDYENATATERKAFGTENADKVADMAQSLMQKVADRLAEGDWGVERGTGGTADPLDPFRIEVMRDVMKVNPKIKKAFTAIPSDEQAKRRAFLLDIARKHQTVEDEAARRMEADRKAKARLAEGLGAIEV